MNGHSRELVARNVADLRQRAVDLGRAPNDILVVLGASVIVAPTGAEARDLYEEYKSYIDPDGIVAQFSARLGIDLSKYDRDEPLPYQKTNAMHSAMDALTRTDLDRGWTVPSRGAIIVGSPSEVADELAAWVPEADVDGFNLARLVHPENLKAIVRLLVPKLQDRGIYKKGLRSGSDTSREVFQQPSSSRPAPRSGAQETDVTRSCRTPIRGHETYLALRKDIRI